MSDRLPCGIVYYYGLFCGDNQIGFQCFANYTPHRKGTKLIMHSNRTVIHPDYVGLGLGVKFINATCEELLKILDCRIMGRFSSVPVYKAFKKDKNWILRQEILKLNKQKKGRNMQRNTGFRDRGIKIWSFEYIPNKNK